MAKVSYYTMTLATDASYTSDISISYGRPSALAVVCPTMTSWCITATGGIKLQHVVGTQRFDLAYFDKSAATRAVWNPQQCGGYTFDCPEALALDQFRLKMSNAATNTTEFYVIVRTSE